MNKIYNHLWVGITLVALISIVVPEPAHARKKRRLSGMMPVELDVLFAALPEKVEGWKLTESKGWRGRHRWMEAVVVREFEKVDIDRSDKPVERTVRMTVQDTAKFPQGDIRLFSNFTPGVADNVEQLYIKSVPVIIIQREDRIVSQFLLEERFILTITFRNIPKSEVGDWFRSVKVPLLASVKEGPIVKLPENVVDQSIDQLKGNNKRFVLGLGDDLDEEEEEEEEDGEEQGTETNDE